MPFLDVSVPGYLFEYHIEHVTIGPLYFMFKFSIGIYHRGVPGFATDCPCGVWCLYVYFWQSNLK